jgi:hypothetical protein
MLVAVMLVAISAALVRQMVRNRELQSILTAHELSADFTAPDVDEFRVQVTPLARSANLASYEIAIESAGPTRITVASAGSRSESNMGQSGQPPTLLRSSVVIVADLIDLPGNNPNDPATSALRILAQIRDREGTAVGGPSTYYLPAGKLLEDLFHLDVKPGVYARGKAISLFELNGEKSTLTVQ